MTEPNLISVRTEYRPEGGRVVYVTVNNVEKRNAPKAAGKGELARNMAVPAAPRRSPTRRCS